MTDRDLRDEFSRLAREYKDDSTCNFLSRPKVKAVVWDKSSGRCWYCGCGIHPFRNFSIDHVTPLLRAGNDSYENLVPCCRNCNARKGGRDLEQFRDMMNHEPLFTDEQREYLKSIGTELPQRSNYTFYFEKIS